MQLGTSFAATSSPHMLRLDNNSERSSLPLSVWLAAQNAQQMQPLQTTSLNWASSSTFDSNRSLEMTSTATVAVNPLTGATSLYTQPSTTPLISPPTPLGAPTAVHLMASAAASVSPSPTLANRQLIEAAQQQQQHQQHQHMIQEQHRQRMQQPLPSSSTFFNPFEQGYLPGFLNALSSDKHTSPTTVAAATTATTIAATATTATTPTVASVAGSNAQSPVAVVWGDRQVLPTQGTLHAGENAYPSPEPYKPSKLALLQRTVASQGTVDTMPTTTATTTTAAATTTTTVSASGEQSKKRSRDATHYTSLPRSATSTKKRVSANSADRPINATGVGEDADSSQKKELLTEEQKRSNHIRSEQKRRDTIRQGFQDLSECVPALRGARVSKSVMLEEAAAWINLLEADCRRLQNEISLLETRMAMRREMVRRNGQAL